MLRNIDINQMNRLMEENEDAKQIITQLLKNYHSSVSMIAHEIRNPLTLVSSSLHVIEVQHPEVKEFSSWKQTTDDVRFMCGLLNDLTDYNNGHSLHYSVFQIERLIRNVAVSFALSLDAEESEIEFSSQIIPGMGDFTGDKIKLEQVILNLLRNAKEAVTGQGTIFLRAERVDDNIVIECIDNGCGIPEDIADQIFEPFFSRKENGTGLGLSVAKQIVTAHSGTISAGCSDDGKTVFTVTLPV